MSYSQLGASERDEIYKLRHTTALSMRAIARQLRRSQSTLSRELARNQNDKGMYYFANPYHSWERGLNEHTNGLLRQFFLKKTNFKWIEPEALENAVTLINDRPRKSLDYKTPSEVFYAGKSDDDALQI